MLHKNFKLIQLLLVLSGIVALSFGITLGVIADVILNSGEAFVKALADVIKKDFGNMKIAFDVTWVLLSIVLNIDESIAKLKTAPSAILVH